MNHQTKSERIANLRFEKSKLLSKVAILREALARIIQANERTSDPHVEVDVTARQALKETE